MLMQFCSNDKSGKYGATVFLVDNIFQSSVEGAAEALATEHDHVVEKDIAPDNIWGCPSALVIDVAFQEFVYPDPDPENPEAPLVGEWVTKTVVRPKAEAEFLVDQKEVTIMSLERTTEERIKRVADTDRQNSLSIMYNNMSTTDKGRAKLYFDWHKSMLAKHYETKSAIIAAPDFATLDALVGTAGPEAFTEVFAELMAAAPLAEVDLQSYIH